MRYPKKRHGSGFSRFGSGGGEEESWNAAHDPGEGAFAARESAGEPVEAVCGWTEKNPTNLRGGEYPHNTVKRIGVIKGPSWHGGIIADKPHHHGIVSRRVAIPSSRPLGR
jgi:hypothetical protein